MERQELLETMAGEIVRHLIVEIAIRCAMTTYGDPKWNEWAAKWLSDVDRTADAAEAVKIVDRSSSDSTFISADSAALAAAWADLANGWATAEITAESKYADAPTEKARLLGRATESRKHAEEMCVRKASDAVKAAIDANPDLDLPGIVRRVCGQDATA